MASRKQGGGVICPTITMFKENGDIDFEGTSKHLNWLIDNGVHSIFALGTTQENAIFTEQEYKQIVDLYVEGVAGRVPLYFGVSSTSTRIAIEHAQYCEKKGADAVFAGGPYYMRVTEDELMQFHRDIASSVNIPYLLYNNPGLAKLGLSVWQIAKLTEEGVVKMIKDTTGNPVRTQDLKMYCKDGTKVFFGDDYGAFQAMCVGADGWTAGIANIIPKECVEIWNKVVVERNFDEGFKLWKKVLPLLNMTIDKGSYGKSGRSDWLPIYKAGANLRIGTSPELRKPLFKLQDDDVKTLKGILSDLGY